MGGWGRFQEKMSGFAENQGSSRRYYTCFVPGCTNTTVRTPDKIFIGLPRSDKLRKLWSNAAHRDGPLISASGSACCEDHFTVSSIVNIDMVLPSTLFIAGL